jgi:holo-[acyl-carrier protein] synthase
VIVGIGVDVCQVARLAAALERRPGLVDRLFTPAERTRADGSARPIESLAGRFAAKEALAKALRCPRGLSWTDVEVLSDAVAGPDFALRDAAYDAAIAAGVGTIHLTISHDAGVAVAFVVCEE